MSKKLRVSIVVLASVLSVSSTVFSATPCKAQGCGPARVEYMAAIFPNGTCADSKNKLLNEMSEMVSNDCADEGQAAVCFQEYIIESACSNVSTDGPMAEGHVNYKCES